MDDLGQRQQKEPSWRGGWWEGETGDMHRVDSVCGDHVQIQLCSSRFSHSGIFYTSGTQRPLAAGRMGLEGPLPGLPACLLAPGSSSLGTEDSPSPFDSEFSLIYSTLSPDSSPLIISSRTACCFPGWARPPPSAKCQSSHQMSSSASHPWRLGPRTRAAIADTQQRRVGLLAFSLIVFRSKMGVKMEFEGIASLCLPLSGQPQGRATLRERGSLQKSISFSFQGWAEASVCFRRSCLKFLTRSRMLESRNPGQACEVGMGKWKCRLISGGILY